MNLTWHIVKKDLRALRWPLSLWLLLIVGKLGVGVLMLAGSDGADLDWFRWLDTLAKLLGAFQFVSFVLVAALIQEDLLVGTSAFWQTRPISGGRLLGAKLLSIGLVFGFMPVLVTLPWWLGCGYGMREIAWAAAETVAVQAIAVLLGLLWAVVTDGFGRFLMWSLVTAFSIPTLSGILIYYSTRGQAGPSGDLMSTRLAVAVGLGVLGILGVTVHQFLTRNTWRSVAVIGGTAGLIVIVGAWWPWNWHFESQMNRYLVRRSVGEWPAAAEPPGLKFTLQSAAIAPLGGSQASRSSQVTMNYSIEGLVMSQGALASWSEQSWRWPDGTVHTGGTWMRTSMMESVAGKALNLDHTYNRDEPYVETLTAVATVPKAIGAKLQAEPAAHALQARISLMRLESITPLPVQFGAKRLQNGAGQQVTSVERSGEEMMVTFINHAPSLLVDNAGGGSLGPSGLFDLYYLVNRKNGFVDRGRAVSKVTTRIGTVGIGWQTLAYRASSKGGKMRPLLEAINALNDAELVRVSFVEQARFTHELKIDPFTVEPAKP